MAALDVDEAGVDEFAMWWENSDCLTSNSAISSHWHTASGLRRSTSRTFTRSGSDSALATVAMRSASSAESRAVVGAQQAAAGGAGGGKQQPESSYPESSI